MSGQAPPLGWVVVVRDWNQPDEHYFVTLPNPRHAEAEVRAVMQATWQTTVQAIRELTRDEIRSVGLQPGKIVYAPKK
jgi:hypothetical protein